MITILTITTIVFTIITVLLFLKLREAAQQEKELLTELSKFRVLFYWSRYAIFPYQVDAKGDELVWLSTGIPLTITERSLFSEMIKQRALANKLRKEFNTVHSLYQRLYKEVHDSQPFVDISFDEFEPPKLTVKAK